MVTNETLRNRTVDYPIYRFDASDIRSDAFVNLDVREYQELAAEILSVIREPLVWTRKLPLNVLAGGYGRKEYKWYEQKDVGPIVQSMYADRQDFDTGYLTSTTQKIPVFSKDVHIRQRDLEASRLPPLEPIDLRSQKVIASKLIDSLEQAIGLGITVPVDVNPINQDIQDAGGGAAGWDTVANIVTDTALNYAKLISNKFYGPYWSIHYSTLAGALMQLVGNTASVYEDYVNRIATLGTGYTSYTSNAAGSAAAAATATQTMIEPVSNGQNNFELLQAQAWKVKDITGSEMGLRMKIYGAYIHEIFRATAGAVVDNITDLAN